MGIAAIWPKSTVISPAASRLSGPSISDYLHLSTPYSQSIYKTSTILPTLLPQPNTTVKMTATKASTCCRQGTDAECACAQKATCSCGKESALHCSCGKATAENAVEGPRCSCRARPAGQCTCDRASTENAPVTGSTCQCGARPATACTCEKATDGGYNPANEIDFTNFAK
ncbi:hypothetical protein Trihar35433_3510 [Trichoderma harzianum]|nr:hypothetical protein Trihar35433_3510 [Trichoderma harzianum]